QTVAIVTADLLFVTAELKAALLAAVGAQLGLNEASLLVAASHTHTAPAVDPSKPSLGVCDPDYPALVAQRGADLLGRLAACDPVGFPARTKVSADFPGVVRRALRDAHGAELPVLYLQGFAGDVRPRETGATTRFARRLVELVVGPLFAPFSTAQYAAWAGGLADRVVGVAK